METMGAWCLPCAPTEASLRGGVPERCPASGAAVDGCCDAPAKARQAEHASSLGRHVWLYGTPLLPVTACHHSKNVEPSRKSHYTVGYLQQSATRLSSSGEAVV